MPYLPAFRSVVAFAVAMAVPSGADTVRTPRRAPVTSLHVTILSTMLADAGVGEWGFAALVEVDGHRVLFDTGLRPETVLRNAAELGIDLSNVTDVVLSHHHADHTGGLLLLRTELAKKNPLALSRIHVAPGIFLSRRTQANPRETNPMIELKPRIEATGAVFVEHSGPVEILPSVWLTGPVPRPNAERNWSSSVSIVTPRGFVPDSVPEDQSLVVNTQNGLAVITGCGHAGIVNIVDFAQKIVGHGPAYAVIGGLHLFAAKDETLAWTAQALRTSGLAFLLGAHCTGIEAVFRIRELAGLTRRSAVVAAVGSSFDLASGIDPLSLAQ